MELIWLEDFAALAEHGTFSRAAEARHVTQPAFSRRIRALENWMGAELFERSVHGANLTDAGRQVLGGARDLTRRLQQLRSEAQEVAGKAARTLQFAATHSLSFTFFPRWIRRAERGAPIEAVRLLSDSMANCEQMLLQGQVQFLLCHGDPHASPLFEPEQFHSKVIGSDVLQPLISPALGPGDATGALPYLAYSADSGLGRIVAARLASRATPHALDALFSSHLAAVLMSMALENKGVAWLPESLAEAEVADGALVRAFDQDWDIPLQIQLTRPKAPLSDFAEAFWARL
ncbi:LysR substrate-binding domain-containing protein [Pseudomonas kuykendallii]|uniref:Transcriptional regulator, LysR family n=1 Tax=Pseudomonas kuykendallii TaxID=1007099 RepID=A0A1H3E184_9PSED|nr:LysR family transcriptional regulator [Pseudomonas kuykendallii]MCQ4270074.1 LysR substrate-binding domain-containing protein [Pseudomonas kuykendallii]SDX72048.1 transcriptional regulator, LysR family [Pseudomonas kuykendallii]